MLYFINHSVHEGFLVLLFFKGFSVERNSYTWRSSFLGDCRSTLLYFWDILCGMLAFYANAMLWDAWSFVGSKKSSKWFKRKKSLGFKILATYCTLMMWRWKQHVFWFWTQITSMSCAQSCISFFFFFSFLAFLYLPFLCVEYWIRSPLQASNINTMIYINVTLFTPTQRYSNLRWEITMSAYCFIFRFHKNQTIRQLCGQNGK